MIKASSMEWDTSQLSADRRKYLDSGRTFEEMVSQFICELHIDCVKVKPYLAPGPDEPSDARQAIFVVSIGKALCDELYNGPDGLRGRYWQSPDHGFLATRLLINTMLPDLVWFAEENPPTPTGTAAPMIAADIRASLQAPSAKIWPRERDNEDNFLLTRDKLDVTRWSEYEQTALFNKGMWRRSPTRGELEIKGAILGTDGTEHVPKYKRDRSCQIHQSGFT